MKRKKKLLLNPPTKEELLNDENNMGLDADHSSSRASVLDNDNDIYSPSIVNDETKSEELFSSLNDK